MSLARKMSHPLPSPLSEKTQMALASLRLESIFPSESMMQDIALYEKGNISLAQLLEKGLKRIKPHAD
jgi:hypothetical protein